jgi:hypothetical protein
MVRNALIHISEPVVATKRQQSFKPYFSQLPTGLSGAKSILRPSMMRAHAHNHREVTSRIRDRLSNNME